MTNAIASQQVALAAETAGSGNVIASQLVVIVADNSLPPADHDTMSQAIAIAAETAGVNTVSASAMISIVANTNSTQVVSLSQMVLIVVGIEFPIIIPLFPFQVGINPVSPMYRR